MKGLKRRERRRRLAAAKSAPIPNAKPRERRSGVKHDRVVDVAAGLIFRDGKLLIAQRRPGDHLGGMWEFPGGKRELGETFKGCLQREVQEELGILVEPTELVGAVTHRYPEKTVHLQFFRCLWQKHEPKPLGCQAFAWIERNQLDQFSFPAADAKLLRKLKRTPQLWR